ncbi:MAG: hypothetical protein ACW99U_10420 [Candidatus Thorarchaeota archaeon]|jgi:hypothetical protein
MADKLTIKEFHSKMAKETNNGIWPVLDKKRPTKDELENVLHMAHASRFHWGKVGTIVNAVRAEYMIARVYSKMGRGEPALFHAERGLKLARKAKKEDKNWKDWDMPFIYEVLARAHCAAGNSEGCTKFRKKAQRETDKVKDPQDKAICQGEIDNFSC